MVNYYSSHIFCHSPKSWVDLYNDKIFKKESVEVQVKLVEIEPSCYGNH